MWTTLLYSSKHKVSSIHTHPRLSGWSVNFRSFLGHSWTLYQQESSSMQMCYKQQCQMGPLMHPGQPLYLEPAIPGYLCIPLNHLIGVKTRSHNWIELDPLIFFYLYGGLTVGPQTFRNPSHWPIQCFLLTNVTTSYI